MTESTALVPVGQMSIQEIMTIGKTMAESGFFSDAKDAAKAVVKILAGREMGFGPFASMTGISIIQGKPSVGANLMASAVKANPRYDYRIVTLQDDGCELAFFEGGREIGRSAFTKENAAAAGLIGKENWKKFPRNMYFARALSNGVRWYCPDVFNGNAVYTPEELGATVDAEGEIIDLEPTITATDPPPARHWIDCVTESGQPIRPRFWAWATGDGNSSLGLTNEQVYTALEVEHIHDFAGTMQEAKDKIIAWQAAQQDQEHTAEAEEE